MQGVIDAIVNYNAVRSTYMGEEGKKKNNIEDEKILEDRRLTEMQRIEYLEAKFIDELKKKEEMEQERKKIEEEELKRQKEEQERKENQERKAKRLASIPEEPEPDKDTTSEIAFRLASGKRIIRRFPKDCTIQVNKSER
jgi:nucleoporin GLE1